MKTFSRSALNSTSLMKRFIKYITLLSCCLKEQIVALMQIFSNGRDSRQNREGSLHQVLFFYSLEPKTVLASSHIDSFMFCVFFWSSPYRWILSTNLPPPLPFSFCYSFLMWCRQEGRPAGLWKEWCDHQKAAQVPEGKSGPGPIYFISFLASFLFTFLPFLLFLFFFSFLFSF